MIQVVNQLPMLIMALVESWKNMLAEDIEGETVRYDGWFIVLMAVLLTLAFSIFAGLTIWCVVYQGGTFTGNWEWYKWGVSVRAECAV